MKECKLLFVFVCFFYFQTFSQTDTIKVFEQLIFNGNYEIQQNSIFLNTSTIIISDTLFIFGKLINNGTIQAKNCVVKGGELHSEKTNNLQIINNMHFDNATTTSADSLNDHLIMFSVDTIFIDGYTDMKSARFNTNYLYINATLEFSGKLGAKTIKNDFVINTNGELKNTNNENIQLYGNAYNYSKSQCKNANFELLGIDKGFYGDFSCYRFDLKENTNYTNYGKLTITDIFNGKGTLIQAENSYLKIQTQSSSKIQASALGNTIEFTRGGEQFLNTNECYNLIISKQGDNFLSLSQNTTVLNSLEIKNKSYLNCNGFQLTLPQATENSIIVENSKNNKGIILNDGCISIENFNSEEQLYFPLYTNDTIYAGIKITNNNETPINFVIDSCFHFVTKNGKSTSKLYKTDFVNLTWHIQSDDSYQLSFYWNTTEELPNFEEKAYTIYQSNGSEWEDISCEIDNFSSTLGNGSHYYSVGNKIIILPITLSKFYAKINSDQVIIQWKLESNVDNLFLEKSYDGFHFSRVAKLPTNTLLNIYYDTFSFNQIEYYRLVSQSNDTKEYSSIICVSNSLEREIIITPDNIQVTNTDKKIQILLYNQQGKRVKGSITNRLSISDIPKGIYYLQIISDTVTYFHAIHINNIPQQIIQLCNNQRLADTKF